MPSRKEVRSRLNSNRSVSLFRTQIRERQSLLPDQDSLFRSLGNSLKKRSDLASFELIQRLDRPQNEEFPCIFP